MSAEFSISNPDSPVFLTVGLAIWTGILERPASVEAGFGYDPDSFEQLFAGYDRNFRLIFNCDKLLRLWILLAF
jgi:hypothetical protein